MPCLQQDLVVEGLPLGVVSHGDREVTNAGNQVLCDPGLVGLLPSERVLQLRTHVTDITAGHSRLGRRQ